MQLDKLLQDVTQMAPGTSRRQQCIRLVEMLEPYRPHPPLQLNTVIKWFDRGSLPAMALIDIAKAVKSQQGRDIDFTKYA